MNYYFDVLKKYAVFDGRATRKEYWMFVLFNLIISIVLSFLGNLINFTFLSSIYSLAVLIPSLAVLARRLHDTGRSGWWILLILIPFIGAFVLIVFAVLESQPGQNQYGSNLYGATVATQGKNPYVILVICLEVVALIFATFLIIEILRIGNILYI